MAEDMPQLTAPGKLIALLALMAAATVLVVTGDIDATAWLGIVGPLAGYLVGNGAGALRGQSNAPVFEPKREPELLELEGGAVTIRRLTPAEVARRDELLGRLAALDEDERRELRELVRAGA